VAGDGEQRELRAGSSGSENIVPSDARHEGDQTVGYGDESHKHDAHGQAEDVWPHIAEKPS
jgi:hypothetical protein